MGKHTCMRCGLEARCSHGSWADRHPYAAVLYAVPVTLFVLAAVCAYPWLLAPLTIALVACVVDREHRRRAALAARADAENAAYLAAPVPPVQPLPHRAAHTLPWQLARQLETEPLHTPSES